MNLMDGCMSALKLSDGEEYDDGDYLDDEDYQAELKATKNEAEPEKKAASPRTAGRNKRLGNGMEVCVIKPTGFDDSREVIDTLLSNRTVVLNMEGMNSDVAQRIFDVVSGGTYAINGKLQKIANNIFILTPASVDISGDFQGILSESF